MSALPLSGLFFIYSGYKVLKMVKSYSIEIMFLTFKHSQSTGSQTFYCLVIFYFAISSQIPRISNLSLYIVYYLLYCHLYC